MTRYPKYRRALRALRLECPVDHPVRVRLCHLPNPKRADGKATCGWVDWSRDGASINLTLKTRYAGRRRTDEELAGDLLHEWAHAMTMAADTPHSPEWGVAYARVYSAVVED